MAIVRHQSASRYRHYWRHRDNRVEVAASSNWPRPFPMG